MALATGDESQVQELEEARLTAEPAYVGLLRDALQPYQARIVDMRWETFHDKQQSTDRRFRAGLALAMYAPQDSRWAPDDYRLLADELVASNPEHLSRLRDYLRPVSIALLGDLERSFANRKLSDTVQLGAANALAEFARDDGSRIARLLAEASPLQYKVLYPLVASTTNEQITTTLSDLVVQQPAADLPHAERLSLGQRRAGAAITLLRQGRRDEIFPALRVQDDPESLTQFVHRCREREVRPQELLECVRTADTMRQTKTGAERTQEDRVLFGLLLALGEFELTDLPETNRQPLIDQLVAWYGTDPSSAIHGASGWLLRRWKQDEAALKVDQTPVAYLPDREWYTIEVKAPVSGLLLLGDQSLYLTFVVIPAREYWIGSPTDEPERESYEARHRVRLTRPFAILDREITRGEFEASGIADIQGIEQYSASPLHTMVNPNWYDSVRFCRWLGERAGLSESQQAYRDPAMLDANKFPADPDPQAKGAPLNWPVHLEAAGFRLPTEAEWEVACRSGAVTPYGFGGDASLLDRYGWFMDNSGKKVHVPRQQRPNLRGLFDMHGNAFEWCHDWDTAYEAKATDPIGAPSGSNRVTRGGGLIVPHKYSAGR